MLEPEFEIGIKVLALVHAGDISVSCQDCNDYQKKQYHCENPSEEAIYEHDSIGEFGSCPVRWISTAVYEWWDEFSYYKLFEGTAPKYGDHNVRFYEACKTYQTTYDNAAYKQQDKPKDELSKFKKTASLGKR